MAQSPLTARRTWQPSPSSAARNARLTSGEEAEVATPGRDRIVRARRSSEKEVINTRSVAFAARTAATVASTAASDFTSRLNRASGNASSASPRGAKDWP